LVHSPQEEYNSFEALSPLASVWSLHTAATSPVLELLESYFEASVQDLQKTAQQVYDSFLYLQNLEKEIESLKKHCNRN